MTPEQLARLSDLLDEALDLEPFAQRAWLEGLHADDDVATTLRRLLQAPATRRTADLLERGAGLAALRWEPIDAAALAADDRVGPYRLVRLLGQGGMGEVWLAERDDGQLKRRVALKLPDTGLRRRVLRQRFERERDILAALEHPHIARLYDAGSSQDGQPYLAMEYVEGRPIDEWCEAEALDIDARLHLLLQACDAVAFAHSRLVLHRDLKPSNILVNSAGQVRLLDFGIAKLMEGDRAVDTALTREGGRALTPDYASPEQLRGESLGTASDVYSLGVVAFELLAGKRPPRRNGAGDGDPDAVGPQASRTATDPARRRRLQGDLDAILRKALQHAPAQRYATVDALARDCKAHLEGRAISARRDTLASRTLRQARRHRVPLATAGATLAVFGIAQGLGATAVAVAGLTAGLGLAVLQQRRAAAERDRALALAERNAAGNEFLSVLLTRAARGAPVTAAQLVERAEHLVDSDVRGQPEHRAFVLAQVAGVYSQLDQASRALQVFERAITVARAGADRPLLDAIEARRAVTLGRLGRHDDAVAAIDALLARDDLDPEVRFEVHAHRTSIAHWGGEFEASLEHAAHALRWYRLAPRAPRRAEPVLLALMGWSCLKNGRVDEAERHYAQSVAAFQALGLADSGPALQHRSNQALMFQELGDLEASIAAFDAVLASAQRAMPDQPPPVVTVANRAYSLSQAARFDEAEAAFAQGAQLAHEQGQKILRYNLLLLQVEMEVRRGRPSVAQAWLGRAEAERDFEVAAGGPATFARQIAEAHLALGQGRPGDALGTFTEALQSRQVAAGTVDALLGRAAAHRQAGDAELARTDAADALALARTLQGRRPTSYRVGLALIEQARIEAADDHAARAVACARQALPHLRAQLGPAHPAWAVLHELRGEIVAAAPVAAMHPDATP